MTLLPVVPISAIAMSDGALLFCRYEIAQENKRLSEPLSKALKEVESLRTQLASYEKDKASLQQSKARLAAAEKQVSVIIFSCVVCMPWQMCLGPGNGGQSMHCRCIFVHVCHVLTVSRPQIPVDDCIQFVRQTVIWETFS